MSDKLNRRTFLKATGSASAVGITALAGCTGGGGSNTETTAKDTPKSTATESKQTTKSSSGSGDNQLSDTLNFYSWGGSTQKALNKYVIQPFEDKYGVTVKQSSFGSQSDMLANVRSSPPGSYDIIMPSTSGAYTVAKQDLVEPIRTENMENWSNLMPVFQDFTPDPGSTVHVAPLYYGTVGLAYNSDHVSGSPPFSWDLAFDSQYKGRVILEQVPYVRVFQTALDLGMDPNQITVDGSYEKGIKKVYDKLSAQQKLVKKYWSSGQEMVTLYSNETAYLGEAWGGRILALRNEGHKNLHYTIPKEGAYGWSDSLAIAKGSKHRYTAEKFIDFAYQDSVMKKLSPEVGYPPTTQVSSSAIKALPDFDSSGGERLKFQDMAFKAKHQQDWSDTFQKIKLGQY